MVEIKMKELKKLASFCNKDIPFYINDGYALEVPTEKYPEAYIEGIYFGKVSPQGDLDIWFYPNDEKPFECIECDVEADGLVYIDFEKIKMERIMK